MAVSVKCFASYGKKRKHRVALRLRPEPAFDIVKGVCECEAGEGVCRSHVWTPFLPGRPWRIFAMKGSCSCVTNVDEETVGGIET